MFEALEQRRLLVLPISGTVIDLDDSPDVAFVTAGNDVIEIILSGGNIQVRNGAGTVLDQRSATGITGISVNGQGGNDFIRIGRADGSLIPNVPVTIRGGSGNDTITGGLQSDQLFGDDGNDRLDGRAAGDVMNGGTGFDTADYGYRTRSINVSLTNSGTANDGTNTSNSNTPALYNDGGADNLVDVEGVIGSSNQDLMTGSSAANWFDGGGGNDSIFGGAGIDTIIGGVHTDLAYGENDADFFFMQDSTADQFLGGAGTTSAQFDAALDTAAPAAFSASLFASFAEADGELELDDTFDGGQVVTLLDGELAHIYDVAIQPAGEFDEKIIVVGTMFSSESENYDFLVARYNSDGSLDSSFGDGGFSLIDFGGVELSTDDMARSLAIAPDGSIIVVGGTERTIFIEGSITWSEYAIARLSPEGELDTDFGFGGLVTGAPDDVFSSDVAHRVVIQYVEVDNEIFEERYIVTGILGSEILASEATDSVDWGTLRLTNTGEYDDSFGGGLVRSDFSDIEFSSDDYATGLAIDPETGNVWVSGYRVLFNEQFVVKGFTANGEEIAGLQNFYDFEFSAIALDAEISDGRLIVVGQVFQGENPSGAGVATFSIDPNDDASLITSTYVTTEAEELLYRSVAVNQDGVIVAAGNWGEDFYLECFDPETLSIVGSPVLLDFGLPLDKDPTPDLANGVAIQSDGKIVIAGIADDPHAALARLQPVPTEEPPFVDVILDGPGVQSFMFTFVNENNQNEPIPDYLVNRLKALKPDGTLEIMGTELDDVICVSEDEGIITVELNGELMQYNAEDVKEVVIHGLGGNDILCAEAELPVPVKLHGGRGNDVLVGSDQDDELYGEDGRDILIGGRGRDMLVGGADEDILIGGYTSFDESPADLARLMAEWGSGRNQSQRFANLNGGANGNNGNIFLKPGKNVFDDADADELRGEGGDDWFFAKKKSADNVLDIGKGEHLTQL